MTEPELVITGSGGFLGTALVQRARASGFKAIEVKSPRKQGIDLASKDARQQLHRRIRLKDPLSTAVVHAAAQIDWSASAAAHNLLMTSNVAAWASEVGIGFGLLVSSVSVAPDSRHSSASPSPADLYGVGKAAAEMAWVASLSKEQSAIVRVAGIWGWQQRPSLFWNRLLKAAATNNQQPIRINNPAAERNYITSTEAAQCIIECVRERLSGVYLAAGRETVSMSAFVERLRSLPNSQLDEVEWGESEIDRKIYEPSVVFTSLLRSFPDALEAVWADRPPDTGTARTTTQGSS